MSNHQEVMAKSLSVVITTYNRESLVPLSVQSVLVAFAQTQHFEVIVVDDASVDNTLAKLKKDFSSEIALGLVKVVNNTKNQGVTASKNEGFLKARNNWVIFLDSDDTILPHVGGDVISALCANADKPIVFFRCVDQMNRLIGKQLDADVLLDLNHYLVYDYGEALTAVNRCMVGEMLPYPSELRGYEGLGCCRLINKLGPALLSKIVARTYYTEGDDRLSVSKGLLNRMPLLARGHWFMVREFWGAMPITKRIGYLAKATVYYALGYSYRLLRRLRDGRVV